MSEIISIVISAVIFIAIMVIFTKEKMDYVAWALLGALIACIVYAQIDHEASFDTFLGAIEFDALVFIISMQIIVSITERYKIFQWIVLKAMHLTKGDHRKFFYLICFIASISSAVVSDITVGIIFVPLVIRACKILKIDPSPYLFGLSFTINIGSIWTPFSSSENILIGSSFNLDFIYFITHFTPIVIIILLFTTRLLDYVMLSKIDPPQERQKKILMEIMDPGIVIVDKKTFKLNMIYFAVIIFSFVFFPDAYLPAAIGAVALCLLNRKQFVEMLKEIDWKVISFFIAIFLIIGTMELNGTFDYIGAFVGSILSDNVLIAAITVLLLISVLSGFLAQIPTAIVFITLMQRIYGANTPNLIVMAIILGINIGSNFLPQGAACDLITLNLAEKNKVKGYNYKTLLKNGSIMTLLHIVNSILYMTIFYFVVGQYTV